MGWLSKKSWNDLKFETEGVSYTEYYVFYSPELASYPRIVDQETGKRQ